MPVPLDPSGLRITISVEEFVSGTGSSTSDSSKMTDVITKLTEYHADPKKATRNSLCFAFYTWMDKKEKEFKKADKASSGLVRKLAVQSGLDSARPKPPVAVLFHKFKQKRNTEDTRLDPEVTRKSRTVAKSLEEYVSAGKKVAVIVIDLYGKDMKAQGLTNEYSSDSKEEPIANVDSIKNLLKETAGLDVYICSKKNGGNLIHEGKELIKDFKKCIPEDASKIYVYSDTNVVCKGTLNKDNGGNTLVDDLKAKKIDTVFVVGFDANSCVGSSIFGSNPNQDGTRANAGLLDYGFNVVTSIRVVGAGPAGILNTKDGWPYMGDCTKGSLSGLT